MATLKKVGFFWGEDKFTLVELDKNAPAQVIFSPFGPKTDVTSALSSNLSDEVQMAVILKKTVEDNQIGSSLFHVSLPMKEIILRSFSIPYVKRSDVSNAIKFESKRYIPFEINDLSYVFHLVPFEDNRNKRYQVIFYAVRKEVLARYERIFKQINLELTYVEPCIVSLAKSLIFRKEITPDSHYAFLILDKTSGRICFIDNGIPQFIREFPIGPLSKLEDSDETREALNLKIVNEVGNSFDFYGRQFNGERIENVLLTSSFVQKDLVSTLEAELKIKIANYSPEIVTTAHGQSNDLEAIYAMGSCLAPPLEAFSSFNFITTTATQKTGGVKQGFASLKEYKESLLTVLTCVVFLVVVFAFFNVHLLLIQAKYGQLVAKQGASLTQTQEAIQAETQTSTDQLAQFKGLRVRSEVTDVIVRVAAILPVGVKLSVLDITYPSDSEKVSINIQGMVDSGTANQQLVMVNQIFASYKTDKSLQKYVDNVNLISISRSGYKNRDATAFVIRFS
jgi:hypothetical protein